jgi:hypothetical protein
MLKWAKTALFQDQTLSLLSMFSSTYFRGAQIPGTRLPWQQSFFMAAPNIMDPYYGNYEIMKL